MKKTLSLLLVSLSFRLFAQTYPFAEGFEGLPSNQPPNDWGGSMKVLVYHGLNDLKALCARVSSAVMVDSAITPVIGPLTSTSTLSFYYRVIDQNIYPSTPTIFNTGDSIEVMLSTDSINYQTVFLITMDNHTSSFNFVKRKVFVPQFAGNNVNFKFRCKFGTGAGYYVDIDTVVVKDDPQAGVEDLTEDVSFSLYPNPVSQLEVYSLKFTIPQQLIGNEFALRDIQGRILERSKLQTSNLKLLTSSLPPGFYFLQIGNISRKLIVK